MSQGIGVGTRLGGWAAVESLGDGPFGPEWLVRRDGAAADGGSGDGPAEAVAFLLPERVAQGGLDVVKRVLAEAKAAAKLAPPAKSAGPGPIRVLEVGAFPDMGPMGAYFIVERVPPADAAAAADLLAAGGPIPAAEATRIIADAAAAMAPVHSAGLGHRDLQPGNLLLRSDGAVRPAGLGLTALIEAVRELTSGVAAATPAFAAPEAGTRAAAATPAGRVAADVYSLGAAYYTLLTGRPPFEAPTSLQVLHLHKTQPPPDPRKTVPDLPEACGAAIRRAMSKRPIDRHPTVDALRAELTAILAKLPKPDVAGLMRRRGLAKDAAASPSPQTPPAQAARAGTASMSRFVPPRPAPRGAAPARRVSLALVGSILGAAVVIGGPGLALLLKYRPDLLGSGDAPPHGGHREVATGDGTGGADGADGAGGPTLTADTGASSAAAGASSSGVPAPFMLPDPWEGSATDSVEGNPAKVDGRPRWRVDQVWPADPAKPANYRPMPWNGRRWEADRDALGGQPNADIRAGRAVLSVRGEWNGGVDGPKVTHPGRKVAALSFIAPEAGTYSVSVLATAVHFWGEQRDSASLTLYRCPRGGRPPVADNDPVAQVKLPEGKPVTLSAASVELAAGDELAFVAVVENAHHGADVTLREPQVRLIKRASAAASAATESNRGAAASGGDPPAEILALHLVPDTWEGVAVGDSLGNPFKVDGRPRWRLDQVWPAEHLRPQNYRPLPWDGQRWHAAANEQGGQPSAEVHAGKVVLAVRGEWNGNPGRKLAALTFIVPEAGTYSVTIEATLRFWEGQKDSASLWLLNSPRADRGKGGESAVLARVDLPHDKPVTIGVKAVELRAGDELTIVPVLERWHTAGNVTLREPQIRLIKRPLGATPK